ncbi:hypothetical protein KIPB_011342, partial [Kipferlia bialata]
AVFETMTPFHYPNTLSGTSRISRCDIILGETPSVDRRVKHNAILSLFVHPRHHIV